MNGMFLLIVMNFAIMAMLFITTQLLGLDSYFQGDYMSLFLFSAVFGFGGAFISLLMSKKMAKMSMRVRVIDSPANEFEEWYVNCVQEMSHRVGIKTPEIGIFEGRANAFATGANKNNALVAVSTGLVNSMTRDEVEGVIAHEMAHVVNGDMVTMTLLQGVLNTLVIFLARIIGNIVDKAILKNNRGHGIGYMITTIVAELILGLIASIIAMWFSRYREFRADSGGANLAGKDKMVAALRKLARIQTGDLDEDIAAFGISANKHKFAELFSSHPPLEDRIKALLKG